MYPEKWSCCIQLGKWNPEKWSVVSLWIIEPGVILGELILQDNWIRKNDPLQRYSAKEILSHSWILSTIPTRRKSKPGYLNTRELILIILLIILEEIILIRNFIQESTPRPWACRPENWKSKNLSNTFNLIRNLFRTIFKITVKWNIRRDFRT